MEILVVVGKVLLIAFAVVNVALPLVMERRNYGFVWQTWRRFRVGMFLQCFGVLLLVVIVGVTLSMYVPGLKYGWLNLFVGGGGNVLLAPVTEGMRSDNQLIRLLPPLFFAAFMFIIPFLAKAEEEMFRKGHENWGRIVWQSVKFGFAHCFVGVPLAFGIALIITGLFYAYHYKRTVDRYEPSLGYFRAQEKALEASTIYHSMCNTIVLAVLLLLSVVLI